MKTETLQLAKEIAHDVWIENYSDSEGDYLQEKLTKNDSVSTGHPDNMLFFWQQFDTQNQNKFLFALAKRPESEETAELEAWISDWYDEAAEMMKGDAMFFNPFKRTGHFLLDDEGNPDRGMATVAIALFLAEWGKDKNE